MSPKPPMGSSTPRLSDLARHVVFPSDIETTAWPRVVARCRDMGVEFDAWQHGVGSIALGKRRDGKYAATVGGVVLSIPRQVGKTFFVAMVVIALATLYPNMTILWTAQRLTTSNKTFDTFRSMARRKKIAPFIASVRTANGEQQIKFTNGSVVMFGAREYGFGRGFDEVDVEVFDEAQILTEKALEDMIPAVNQSRHEAGGLVFFMGTPPRPVDNGEEFRRRRDKALSGKSKDMVYVEFSADEGADPDDREQWRMANPSYPHRTPDESMLRMRENLTDELSFMREAMGIWDSVGSGGVIPFDAWQSRVDALSVPADVFALGVEAAPDLASAAVSLAGRRVDGDWHVELVDHRKGGHWLDAYVADVVERNPQVRSVVVDVGGPLGALLEEHAGGWRFRGSKVRVQPMKVKEIGQACTRMLDGVVAGGVWSTGQPQLDLAVQGAAKRPLGDTGMWTFSRKSSTTDITPIQSATWALFGSQQEKVSLAPVASSENDGSVTIL